jgi:phosphatidylglycerol lysyltransferase
MPFFARWFHHRKVNTAAGTAMQAATTGAPATPRVTAEAVISPAATAFIRDFASTSERVSAIKTILRTPSLDATAKAEAVEPPHRDRGRFVALVRKYGVDAVAFQGVASAMSLWLDPERDEAAVAYFDTSKAWIAAGGPVCPREDRHAVASRFVDAARRAGRRVSFFGVEERGELASWPHLHLGEQPSMRPSEWQNAVRASRTLKEQLRRARAKGVVATVTLSSELAPGTDLRREVDVLLAKWLTSRRIEPMSFLVMADPYAVPEAHAYVVARRAGAVVGLLSAVPAYGEEGWLVEHLVSAKGAPNGTAETLLDAFHKSREETSYPDPRISLGLAPLSGTETVWQTIARTLMRPLFDFEGLYQFKARLHPSEWRSVWLVVPEGSSVVLALFDALTAFAGGSLARFALRSLLLRPRGLLWLLAVGLVPWTFLLVWLDLWHEEGVAGYTRAALMGWIAFDIVLGVGLFRAALRPGYPLLVTLLSAATLDAVLSLVHVHAIGLGPTEGDWLLRFAAAVAPAIGATTLLTILMQRARQAARSS